MENKQVDLSSYNNSDYKPAGTPLGRALWFFVNALFFRNPFVFSSALKVGILKCFGAKLGSNVVIKPTVNIKYPWNLSLGNNVWIGESVWIDSLAMVEIGDNVCISQGALILNGNHNYKTTDFALIVERIVIKEGTWIGAKSIVCAGVTCGSHSVLTVGSVASSSMEAYGIYQGNPAIKIRQRVIE